MKVIASTQACVRQIISQLLGLPPPVAIARGAFDKFHLQNLKKVICIKLASHLRHTFAGYLDDSYPKDGEPCHRIHNMLLGVDITIKHQTMIRKKLIITASNVLLLVSSESRGQAYITITTTFPTYMNNYYPANDTELSEIYPANHLRNPGLSLVK